MNDCPQSIRKFRGLTRNRQIADLCNSELNHLTTKYYRLLRFDKKTLIPVTPRRGLAYRGKHSLSPIPARSRFKEKRKSQNRLGVAVTPEPNSEVFLHVGSSERDRAGLTPRQEKTTSTKGLVSPHSAHIVSSPRNLFQEKPDLYVLTLKRQELTLPVLRSKKKINVDMRVLQSREGRPKTRDSPWSRANSMERLTPNA